MPLTNPNVVNATLQLTSASAVDYSTLLIIDSNHLSTERATVYTSVDDYTGVVPEGTALRAALDSAFSPDVKPARVVVGRTQSSAQITAENLVDGNSYGFTITVLDGVSETVSETLAVAGTAEDLFVAIKSTLDANTDITDHVTITVVNTGNDAILEIDPVTTDDDFSLSSLSEELTLESISVESVADTVDGITDFNKDWTYMMSTDHTPATQVALAAQAVLRQKIYVTSTQLPEAYAAWDGETTPDANDVPALFASTSNQYAHVTYHHQADDKYPEAARVTRFTSTVPGSDAFQFKGIHNLPLAHIVGGSRRLNGTELANLGQKNASTITSLGGQPVIQGNRVSNGTRIEAIAFMLYSRQELTRNADTLFLNSRKLGMNRWDIGRVQNAWTNFLNRNISGPGNPRGLDPADPYLLIMPKEEDISFQDRVDGVLRAELTLFLDASIDSTVLNITLTYRDGQATGNI